MTNAAGMSVTEIRTKAAQVHGTNAVFFASVTCIAYGFFGHRDFGWLWALIVPVGWFWITLITALPAAWMIKQVAERRHNFAFYLSGTLMSVRPIWLCVLGWFSIEALARIVR